MVLCFHNGNAVNWDLKRCQCESICECFVAVVHAGFRSQTDVIKENDAHSNSSFPYDDVDEAVEAQPLTSHAAIDVASRVNYFHEGAPDQSDGKFWTPSISSFSHLNTNTFSLNVHTVNNQTDLNLTRVCFSSQQMGWPTKWTTHRRVMTTLNPALKSHRLKLKSMTAPELHLKAMQWHLQNWCRAMRTT